MASIAKAAPYRGILPWPAGASRPRFLPLLAGRSEHLPRGIGVQNRDAEANDEVRPHRKRRRGNEACRDDGHIGVGVVARREEGCAGETSAVMAEPDEQKGGS